MLATITWPSLPTLQIQAQIWVPILIACLSSLATGLTNYPTTGGVVKVLQQIVSTLSFVNHANHPTATFKIPLVPHDSLPVIGSSVTPAPPPKGFAHTELLIAAVPVIAWAGIIATVFSCAHLTPTEQAVIDCGETALAQSATSVAPQVIDILNGGSPSWASQLNSLETSAGNAVICAVQAVISSVNAKADLAPADQRTLLRAQAWLDLQNVKEVK